MFYHDSQKVEMERFEQLLEKVVDTASPQVYIETMVLEVSEEDSKELGVAYQTANIGNNSLLQLGALGVGEGPTVDFERNTRQDVDGNFEFNPGIGIQAQVKALVDEGNAEILARPSVLALSNRQAVIQIVDVIQSPVVQSSIGTTGELVISAYNFEPLLLGITLNLRPRVSSDREWVSLEIDATVEAEVDENSGEVFAPDGEGGSVLLAERKGSAARKVKTFARIPDRTPIIIGGLVASNSEQQKSRVPGLGSIPVFGALFGATDNEVQKREIIIVLTPHVLAEDAIGVRANIAPDAVMSRQSDLGLFNNVYRVSEKEEGTEVLQIQWSTGSNGRPTFTSEMVPASSARTPPGSNTIVLRSERDLQRLTAAIATEIVINQNGGYAALNVSTFKGGMLLSLADVVAIKNSRSGHIICSFSASAATNLV